MNLTFLLEIAPLHPAFVHFPIGALFLVSLFAVISLFTHKKHIKEMNNWLLIAGLSFAVLAISTGIWDQDRLHFDEEVLDLLQAHELNAYISIGLYTILFTWSILDNGIKHDRTYLLWVLLSVLAAVLLIYQASLGGKMVFEHGAGVNTKKPHTEQNN